MSTAGRYTSLQSVAEVFQWKSFTAALSMDVCGTQTKSVMVRLSTRELFLVLAAAYGKTPTFSPDVIIQWIEIE